jgi:hypothetical protein
VRTEVELSSTHQANAANKPKAGVVKALICSEGLPPQKLNSQGPEFFDTTFFLERGDPNRKRGPVNQGFLQVLTNAPEQERRWQAAPPAGWRTSFRRKALTAWLTDVNHGAGALLARVVVNRIWQHHFGQGLVSTPSDFGRQGSAPTHPELLDWLAAELIRNQWRLKPIHRLIVTSATYGRSSVADPASQSLDPGNRWLAHYPRRRLEAEAIRDAILAVSGRLERRMYGPGTLDENQPRRSVYFTVKRSRLIPMMVLFDAPDALQGLAVRSNTTVAPQSLWLMNSPLVRRAGEDFARRVQCPPDGERPIAAARSAHAWILRAYLMALGREPSGAELAAAIAFVTDPAQGREVGPSPSNPPAGLTDFCHVMLCLSEFLDVP